MSFEFSHVLCHLFSILFSLTNVSNLISLSVVLVPVREYHVCSDNSPCCHHISGLDISAETAKSESHMRWMCEAQPLTHRSRFLLEQESSLTRPWFIDRQLVSMFQVSGLSRIASCNFSGRMLTSVSLLRGGREWTKPTWSILNGPAQPTVSFTHNLVFLLDTFQQFLQHRCEPRIIRMAS